ncbi:hypothetical protein BDW72DRAFT_70248 [Aspergillus terricola var. indicus]
MDGTIQGDNETAGQVWAWLYIFPLSLEGGILVPSYSLRTSSPVLENIYLPPYLHLSRYFDWDINRLYIYRTSGHIYSLSLSSVQRAACFIPRQFGPEKLLRLARTQPPYGSIRCFPIGRINSFFVFILLRY